MLAKVKYKGFIFPVIVGIIIWLLTSFRPEGVSIVAWHMLAMFIATIIACITKPLPIMGSALIGLTLTVLFGIVPIDTATEAFGNDTVWLIGMAYFLSRGFIKTGFGKRIALIFVKHFGTKTLGLAYSLAAVDVVSAAATPSNTARAGGIVYPIIDSLAHAFGSSPDDGTQRKIGSFLVYNEFQVNTISSGLFLTGMASNLVSVAMARAQGITISWFQWFIAALAPAAVSLILVPLIIYKLYPPEIKETPDARQWANKQLKEIGPMTKSEKVMCGDFILALVLWLFANTINIDSTLVGFIAVSVLLLFGVLTTDDLLKEKGAWNTIVWFSILIFMANELTTLGFIPWLSNSLGHVLTGFSWLTVFMILFVFYFYSHYLFASGTAHVSAMYGAMLGVALAAGVPHMLAAIILCFAGPLFGSTSTYANGPSSLLFGTGYVEEKDWWKLSFILGIFYLIVWLGGGLLWTKVIGIW